MKRMKITIALILLAAITVFGQRDSKIPLLGQQAPSFTGQSTQGTINFPDDYGNDWKLILSHPQDFTPVCTSELLELASLQDDFKELGVEIVVVSTDMLAQHEKWVEAMENISKKENDPVKIEFDLMALVPQKEWTHFSHCMIFHGRNTCMSRNPHCEECVLASLCPKAGVKK